MSKKTKIVLTVVLGLSSVISLCFAVYKLIYIISVVSELLSLRVSLDYIITDEYYNRMIKRYIFEIVCFFSVCLLNIVSIVIFATKESLKKEILINANKKKLEQIEKKKQKIQKKLDKFNL